MHYIALWLAICLWGPLAHADLRTSNIPGIPAGKDPNSTSNYDGCLQVNAESGRKFGCTINLRWDDGTSTLHVDGTISSPSVSEKDAIQVNSINVTDLNILNTTATTTEAGVTWVHSHVANPDTLTASLAPATDTTAGIVTATDQSFGGTKTFGNGGIELAPKAAEDETPLCTEEKVGVKVSVDNDTIIACVDGTEIDLLAIIGGLEGARAADRSFRGAISENTAVEFCPDVETGDVRCGKYWVSSMGMQEHKPGARLEYISSDAPMVILDRTTSAVKFVLYADGGLCFGAGVGPCLRLDAGQIYVDANGNSIKDGGEAYLP